MRFAFALKVVLLFLFVSTVYPADEPPKAVTRDELVKRLSAIIRQHCPNADVTDVDGTFVAKQGTMVFTVHHRNRDGEYRKDLYQQEGPNHLGFLLKVKARKEPYAGGAELPWDYRETYWRTFFDHAPGVSVWFHYGSRLDRKFKDAVIAAMPRPKLRARPRPVDPKEKK